ncbi:MAG: hypothetical protein ACPGTP_00210 [Bacteroidia bacterium]
MRKAFLPFCVLIVVLSSCRKEKFSSESHWLAPVFETELTLGDLIPDSLSSFNADSSLNIVFDQKFGITDLEDVLIIPDKVETMEVSLSSLVLEDRAFTDTLTLAEIYPASVLLHGKNTTLDAQDVVANEGTVIDVTEQFFTQAKFIEGFIDIKIHNDLPVEAELLEFELLNDKDKSVVVSGSFENLLPFSYAEKSFSLAGKTVDGVLVLLVKRIKTKESNGDVQIDVTKGLRIEFGVRGLKPEVATAVFPSQNLVENEDENKYDFGGPKLTEVHIKKGNILMKVESSIEEAIVLEYLIPNSEDYAGNKGIKKVWTIPAAKPGEAVFVEEKFPIDGYELNMFGKSPHEQPTYNHIFSKLIARIEYSGIERTLSLQDKIKIEFGLVDLQPELVIGDPGYHQFDVKDTLEIDVFNNLEGSLSLEDATLDINFYNSFGIETNVEIESIEAVNNRKPETVSLWFDKIEEPIFLEKAINGIEFIPTTKSVSLNKLNSNLKPFLENLPDQIVPSVSAVLRPYGTLNQGDFAFDTSQLRADLSLSIPLTVGLESFTISSTDSIFIFENENLENIQEARLKIKIDNDFPIGGVVNISFLDGEGDEVSKGFIDDSKTMFAAEVDEISGKTVGGMESELVLELNREQMVLLKNTKVMKINVILDTKDARRYKMYSDYSIDVKVIADIIYENKI